MTSHVPGSVALAASPATSIHAPYDSRRNQQARRTTRPGRKAWVRGGPGKKRHGTDRVPPPLEVPYRSRNGHCDGPHVQLLGLHSATPGTRTLIHRQKARVPREKSCARTCVAREVNNVFQRPLPGPPDDSRRHGRGSQPVDCNPSYNKKLPAAKASQAETLMAGGAHAWRRSPGEAAMRRGRCR